MYYLLSVTPPVSCRLAARRAFLAMTLLLLGLLFFGHAMPAHAAATTYYVSPSGSDSNAGTQAAPFLTLQYGINAAVDGDTVVVEDGTYTGPGDVDLDFGGRNITVTSQNGAASTIIDCAGSSSAYHRGFYLHSGETKAVISGLTIENGYDSGGGIDNVNVSVTVQNCILKNNSGQSGAGGGIFNFNGGGDTITVTNCTLTANSANSGGGIENLSGPNSDGTITVTNCAITGNSAIFSRSDGGGISNTNNGNGTITVSNCNISNNTSTGDGGGIESDSHADGLILVTNCTLTGNTGGYGSGILNFNDQGIGAINVTNCTLTGNTSNLGVNDAGAIDDFNYLNTGTITLTNTIVYGDTGGEVFQPYGLSTAAHCDIEGGLPSGVTDGGGNIDANPLFVNAATGDYHLLPISPCAGKGTSSAPDYLPYAEDYQPRPTPPSIGALEVKTARLVITGIAVSRSGGLVTVTASIHNLGNASASAVKITHAKLGTVTANAPLPGSYTIAAGGVQVIHLTFTTSATGRQPLSIQGTSSGPSFSAGQFVAVP